jgi:Small-conductance mechanosensitive channel
VNLAPVLATAGVTGLAISLGAQQIVRDVLNGFFILVEDQFAVGDEVTIDGIRGTVETMGMRITRIRDDQGRLITLANSSIARVTNHSRGRALLSLEVSIAAEYGLESARAWLTRTCAAFAHPALQTPIEVRGPTTLETARYTFQLRAHAAAGQLETLGDALREHLLTHAHTDGVPLA